MIHTHLCIVFLVGTVAGLSTVLAEGRLARPTVDADYSQPIDYSTYDYAYTRDRTNTFEPYPHKSERKFNERK